MAERDHQFEQDVLRIVYEALADREALAAAMSGQQPVPAPGQSAPSGAPGSGPWDAGVQGGAGTPFPATGTFRCPDTRRTPYEDLSFDADHEDLINDIRGAVDPVVSHEQIVQEAMRRALRDKIREIAGELDLPLPTIPSSRSG